MGRVQYLEGQLPLFVPDTTWTIPKELPNLKSFKEIAIDTETKDDCLAAGVGAGWFKKQGWIAGISLAWDQGSIYIPVKHPDTNCFDHSVVGDWLRDLMSQEHITFVLHHGNYDLGWINAEWGINPPKKIDETGVLASLVDENRLSYSLDNLCHWRGLPGKDETVLKESAAAYGFAKDVKANLWKLPAKLVGEYAEGDAEQTLALCRSLKVEIENQGLQEAYRTEAELVPMVFDMMKRGIKIDIERAEKTRKSLVRRRNQALSDLSDKLSHTIGMEEINSARHLEKFFLDLKIPFDRTEKSHQGKFDTEFLEKHSHWFPQKVCEIRQLEVASSKFLKGFILEYSNSGRIHPGINQFRNEGGGTRSHRFSYSNPPLQQIYGRDSTPLKEELVYEIRGCFLPENGEYWASIDFSQQELRIMVHFAELLGCRKADIAGDKYRKDPSTDFHQMVSDMTQLPRKRAKDCSFAKAYNAGLRKFALMTGMSLDEAKSVMDQYDNEMPFIKEASDICKRVAEKRGYIKLLDGARIHYDFWEPSKRNWELEKEYHGESGVAPCTLEEALRRISLPDHPWNGRLSRAFVFKSFNGLVQGSAARQTKIAMLMCWKEGFSPLLQLHDELCFSLTEEKQGKRISEMMCDAVKLTVPMKTDCEWGINWGIARQIKNKNKDILYGATWDEAQRLRSEGKWW